MSVTVPLVQCDIRVVAGEHRLQLDTELPLTVTNSVQIRQEEEKTRLAQMSDNMRAILKAIGVDLAEASLLTFDKTRHLYYLAGKLYYVSSEELVQITRKPVVVAWKRLRHPVIPDDRFVYEADVPESVKTWDTYTSSLPDGDVRREQVATAFRQRIEALLQHDIYIPIWDEKFTPFHVLVTSKGNVILPGIDLVKRKFLGIVEELRTHHRFIFGNNTRVNLERILMQRSFSNQNEQRLALLQTLSNPEYIYKRTPREGTLFYNSYVQFMARILLGWKAIRPLKKTEIWTFQMKFWMHVHMLRALGVHVPDKDKWVDIYRQLPPLESSNETIRTSIQFLQQTPPILKYIHPDMDWENVFTNNRHPDLPDQLNDYENSFIEDDDKSKRD